MVSTTVIVWLNVSDTLPHASVAHQLRVVVNACGQLPFVRVVVESSLGLASQLSLAVGAWNTGVWVQLIVAFAPWSLNTGLTVSDVLITWLTVSELTPHESVAHHILVIATLQPVPVVSSMECRKLQASIAGAVNTGVPLQATVVFAPGEPIVTVSVTVMVQMHMVLSPITGSLTISVSLFTPKSAQVNSVCVSIDVKRWQVSPGAINGGLSVAWPHTKASVRDSGQITVVTG